MITGYPAQKTKAITALRAFASGAGGRVEQPPPRSLRGGTPAFFGVKPEIAHLWAEVRRLRKGYYWLDNGYFPQGHTYYAATRNAFQADGATGDPDSARLAALGLELAPWRRGGRTVLVCVQSALFFRLMTGTTRHAWLASVVATLEAHTDRPIVIREKPMTAGDAPLAALLPDCHALVTHSSKAAIEAVCAGVPAFVTAPCAAAIMASTDLTAIEAPRYPDDREAWAARLAAAQWTLDEMRSGRCWADLQARAAEAA